MRLLKDCVVRLSAEVCEQKMDKNDNKLVQNFTEAINYVQKQQQRT